MAKRGKSAKPSISSDSEALEGTGVKRSRDGTASAAAAKAAESSGDDRFSLSKFQLDGRFRSHGASSKVEAVDVERSEGDEQDDVGGDEGGEDFEGDDDVGDGGDDGNYNIDDDDDLEEGDVEFAATAEGEGSSAKSKKIAKKLKPMSAEELAAFMKVAPHARAHSPGRVMHCCRSKSGGAWCI